MPPLLEEMYGLQEKFSGAELRERILLRMFANILESHYEVKDTRNKFTVDEFYLCPGRWELLDGMLYGDD